MGAGFKPKLIADKLLDTRRQMRAGADGAGKFADSDHFADGFQPAQGAGEFIMHERHLQTERRRFAVDAVAAADARREFVLLRAAGDDGQKLFHVGNQDVRALRHLHGVAGVAHVAARQAEMKPAAGVVVDGFGHGGGEADDIVVENFFQFALAGDKAGQVGKPFVAAGLDLGEITCRNDFLLHQGLAGKQFNLQPDAELVFVGPDGPHLRAGIARNHGLMKMENDGKVKR